MSKNFFNTFITSFIVNVLTIDFNLPFQI